MKQRLYMNQMVKKERKILMFRILKFKRSNLSLRTTENTINFHRSGRYINHKVKKNSQHIGFSWPDI